ncbi:hypothetical protein RJ40_06980 [Methanofollis aquaemaris]|uniref:L-2-amino-thiazoline-4-carboxylic acid hydrolase n=1 Tax=Methanofollis aquaemaris TaxID=126734 RepID=A0A8A3S5R3_9EURY|nr:hypothetical protein [Methanofollis aquaemaris]QSZ67263.1 hypothetical protein RJ40_06980 [Methanofollis aquaemaris]
MVEMNQIPAEVRWSLATRATTAIPIAYGRAIRGRFGSGFEDLDEEVWEEIGKSQAGLARAFNFPLRDAGDVARAFGTLSVLLLGPELQGEVKVAEGRDCAALYTTACPMVSRAREVGEETNSLCPACRAYTATAVSSLNPEYGVTYRSGICVGDRRCEVQIEPRR